MAFTPRQSAGIFGTVKLQVGTWTATAGEALQTLVVPGGPVWGAQFRNNDSGAAMNSRDWKAAAGTVTNTSTITLNSGETVTSGTYWVLFS